MNTKEIKITINDKKDKIIFTTKVNNEEDKINELTIKETEKSNQNSFLTGSLILKILDFENDINLYKFEKNQECETLEQEVKNKYIQVCDFFEKLVNKINELLEHHQ